MLRYQKNAGAHDLLFGANYGYSTVKGGNYQNIGGKPGALMWTTDDSASTLELFALDRWNFAPRWTLVYGAQYVSADRDAGGVKGSYDSFNPRLGVILDLNGGIRVVRQPQPHLRGPDHLRTGGRCNRRRHAAGGHAWRGGGNRTARHDHCVATRG